jgi:hypothetical protein
LPWKPGSNEDVVGFVAKDPPGETIDEIKKKEIEENNFEISFQVQVHYFFKNLVQFPPFRFLSRNHLNSLVSKLRA